MGKLIGVWCSTSVLIVPSTANYFSPESVGEPVASVKMENAVFLFDSLFCFSCTDFALLKWRYL